ncbi:MAG: dicarboxylate/amino acid:cation symporter, partial [Lawsonibacter sp.]|nr:dicarboxylate/amino acid:cation symporter [Lawsonibacter sp.]
MGEKARKNFVKRMITGLILGVVFGVIASLAKTSMAPDTWNIINMIFFQDITVSAGRSALGLFYIVQTVFTNALKLAIVPMVFFSIIMSVCSMNDMRKLGRIAGKTIIAFVLFYLAACVLAAVASEIVIGMNIYRPFSVDQAAANVTEIETSNILVTIVNAVPDNLIAPMTTNNRMLAVIACAVAIGVCIASMGSQITVFKTFCGEAAQITQKFLDFLIITCSPISVFCMVTRTFAIYGIDQVSNIFSYILVTLLVLVIYLFVAYPAAIAASTHCNPFIFMKKMIKVAIIAFGAAASAPALPLNKETCVNELGCSEEITNFVLPVGMTINMNGTAIM